MAELQEKQYELDGVVFGLDAPVHVEADGWSPGDAEIIRADKQSASGDGVRFGKDRRGTATWGFKLFTSAEDDDSEVAERRAWEQAAELATAWGAEEARQTSGAVVPLRYRVAGQTRRIYGRPRRFTPAPNNFSLFGRIDIVADFATVDHLVYEDELHEQVIRLNPPDDPSAGFVAPFVPPLTTARRSTPRQSTIIVGGTEPTPVILTVKGPVSDARVRVAWDAQTRTGTQPPRAAGSWTAALINPVAFDDPVTLDARPWVRAATKQSGGGVRVSPRVTRISKMWLPPGQHEVVFTGTDPTGTATATVGWRNAHRLPR